MCFIQIQYEGHRKGGGGWSKAARHPLWSQAQAAAFVLALNRANIVALNKAHVLRLNMADVWALNKAHVCFSRRRMSCVIAVTRFCHNEHQN